MAASMAVRLGLRPAVGSAVRSFSRGGGAHCAGRDWRVSHGFAPSDSEYGPLADLPDWSFADGRPGHPWKGQVRRQEQREQFARRVVMLHKEMDHGIRVWEEAQCQKSVQREEKRRQLLKPKGAQLPVKSKNEKWH
ncbi:39S ribosomal protein L52, mitochondrial isoform X1 [Rhinatrema bivittatum]|uniref:39S ribosomal protein L52, mitochondrial isoform X1 n=1 Tax=Rhinatrema bivittatum TaxID=194408 RepID=UPI001128A0AF|nr:39S ribosomal protein L52, mitochondrial isoform X1 [Rhinatrema bivittatum]